MASSPPIINPAETDPLAQLRDIHLPEAIDAFPPAPGWWLLGALILAACCYGLFRLYRYWRSNAYRREALRAHAKLWQEYQSRQDDHWLLLALNDLLKRTALAVFEREQIASVTGETWVSFLDETLGSHEFSMGPGQALIDGNYAPAVQIEAEALANLSREWIKNHRGAANRRPAHREAVPS